jgi:hypothetical protein
MKTSKWYSACAAALVLLLVQSARADTMTYNGVGLNSVVRIHAPGHVADGEDVYAGQYRITYDGNNYNAWCVDIDQYSGTASVTVQSYTVLPNAGAVAYLYDTYADGVTTGTEAAALAASIWEVITEAPGGPFSITGGSFYISGNSAVANRAAAMLATIPGSYEPREDLIVLHSDTKQDMLIARDVGTEVPEPATMALLISGGALGLVRRRTRLAS